MVTPRAPAQRPDSSDPGRRSAHPRIRAHRPGGHQVRLLCRHRRRESGDQRAARASPDSPFTACTRTSGLRSSRSRAFVESMGILSEVHGRGRLRRALCRWRARGALRRRRVCAVDQGVGVSRSARRQHESGLRPDVRILAEPGRAIVAQAGVTLYTVGVVKPVTQRTYMAVDGGMSDNPRPVLYGSGYEAFDVDRPARRAAPEGAARGQALRER